MIGRITTSVLLAGLLVSLASSSALAGGNAGVKLTRGLVNITTGWLEIPHRISERKAEKASWWPVHGTIYGLMMATTRTLYGAWDLITFPFPPYDGPVMEPDTLITRQD